MAFRGNQTEKGIAEKYMRLPAGFAYSMAVALFSEAPHLLTVERPEFSKAPVIDPSVLSMVDWIQEQKHVS